MLGGLVIWQFLALHIRVRTFVADVEKVSTHGWKMRNAK